MFIHSLNTWNSSPRQNIHTAACQIPQMHRSPHLSRPFLKDPSLIELFKRLTERLCKNSTIWPAVFLSQNVQQSYLLTLCLNMSVMILNDVFLRFINPRVKTALDFYSDLAALQSKGVAKHASIHLVKFYSTCLCRHMLCSRLNLSLIVLSLLSI